MLGRWGVSAALLEWQRVPDVWPLDRDAMTGESLGSSNSAPRPSRGPHGPRGSDRLGADPHSGWWPTDDAMRYSMGQDDTDALEPHPFDDGFWLSGGDALEDPPADVTAVSLCRVGREQTAGVEPGNHVVVWLLDEADPEEAESLMADSQLDEPARGAAAENALPVEER